MAESHAVSGLAAKRSELTGEIAHYQALIKRLTADVSHLDAAIKILAPEFDLRSLGNKRVRQSRMGGFKIFKAGESHRLILDALRESKRPLLTTDIIGWIIKQKKLKDNPELRAVMMRTISGSLRRLEGRELVCSSESGRGRALTWKLA